MQWIISLLNASHPINNTIHEGSTQGANPKQPGQCIRRLKNYQASAAETQALDGAEYNQVTSFRGRFEMWYLHSVTNDSVEYFDVPRRNNECLSNLELVWTQFVYASEHFFQCDIIENFEAAVYI